MGDYVDNYGEGRIFTPQEMERFARPHWQSKSISEMTWDERDAYIDEVWERQDRKDDDDLKCKCGEYMLCPYCEMDVIIDYAREVLR